MTERVPFVVLGAGAAGLFAAIHAAEAGVPTRLLEKNRRPGVKILASGGGRCNLTTTREGAQLRKSFRPPQDRFLKPAFAALPPRRLRDWFAAHGVATQEEGLEKVFPEAGRARVVLDALIEAAESAGVELSTKAAVRDLRVRGEEGFEIELESGEVLLAGRVAIGVGGRSYPKTGTTGDGYTWLRAMGHRIGSQVPALAGLQASPPPPAQLSGIALEGAAVRLGPGSGPGLRFERPVLFTHRGLSGPGPMDLAGEIEHRGGETLILEPLGRREFSELDQALLAGCQAQPRRRVAEALPGELPQAVRHYLVERAGVAADTVAGQLRKDDRRRLLEVLMGVEFRIPRSQGWDHAEVTRGGVALDEVDPKTMESRLVPGLHIIGEILDVDGPIGGFNFQAAFATGYLAGLAASAAQA